MIHGDGVEVIVLQILHLRLKAGLVEAAGIIVKAVIHEDHNPATPRPGTLAPQRGQSVNGVRTVLTLASSAPPALDYLLSARTYSPNK